MPSKFSVRNANVRGTPTIELIETKVGNSTSNVFIFSNIPPTFKDLQLTMTTIGSTTLGFHPLVIIINGNVALNYYYQLQQSTNTTVTASDSVAAAGFMQVGRVSTVGATAAGTCLTEIFFPDYANAVNYKTIDATSSSLDTYASGGLGVDRYTGVFTQSAPITSILIGIAVGGNNLTAASTATLYGIPG